MMDELSIGPVPYNEPCAQVGQPDYMQRGRKECNAFKSQLERVLGEPPAGTWFAVKSFPHEFGSYLEVVVKYTEDSAESTAYAFKAESDSPGEWDEIAKAELAGTGVKHEHAVG